MIIIAIDPGPERSGYVVFDGTRLTTPEGYVCRDCRRAKS